MDLVMSALDINVVGGEHGHRLLSKFRSTVWPFRIAWRRRCQILSRLRISCLAPVTRRINISTRGVSGPSE